MSSIKSHIQNYFHISILMNMLNILNRDGKCFSAMLTTFRIKLFNSFVEGRIEHQK